MTYGYDIVCQQLSSSSLGQIAGKEVGRDAGTQEGKETGRNIRNNWNNSNG